MKRLRFEYEVFAVVELSREDVAILTHLCETHYDSAVRALSIAGIGAVLNGASNDLQFDGGDSCEVRVSFRQLDTFCKATETIPLGSHAGDRGLYAQLRAYLHEVAQEASRVSTVDPMAHGARKP